MIRFIRHLLLAGIAPLIGCRPSADASVADMPDPLVFQITETTAATDSLRVFRAVYEQRGTRAEFLIEFRTAEPSDDFPFAISIGTIRRVPSSNASALLADLATALEASEIPASRERVDSLPFEIGLMGTRLSRGPAESGMLYAGEFASDPPGEWIVGKLFLADGEGEVFLALNPTIGRGEFIAKDPEYGNIVVRELARVL